MASANRATSALAAASSPAMGKGHLPFHLFSASQLALHRDFGVSPLVKGKRKTL
jgi:hypothetical protein